MYLEIAELESLIVYGFGAVTLLSVLALWRALIVRDQHTARARLLTRWRSELTGVRSERRQRSGRPDATFLRQLGRALARLRSTRSAKLRDRLLRAGLRSRDATAIFLAAKALVPPAVGVMIWIARSDLPLGDLPAPLLTGLFVLTLAFSFFLPDLYLANLTARRYKDLQKTLPDALDLLVICAEAGLSLDASLSRVASELGPSAPSLADELALTGVELSFLPDRRQALVNFGARCNIPAVRAVVSTLAQTERYGTPLSQALRVLSSEFRDARMLRAEEKAARLPAILTVPMIVFILPALFIVLVGPAMIDVYDNIIK